VAEVAISPKLRAIAAELNDTRRGFGPGTIVVASEIIERPPRITTGSLGYDVILGGGWPPNQWNEIIGEESSGKTTQAHMCIAANQRLDPEFTTVWVAAEDFDEELARQNGVDCGRVILVNTNVMEEAYEATLKYLESHEVDLIVIDSYPALHPESEWDKDLTERAVGVGAYVTGTFFRKSYKATRRSLVEPQRPVFGIFINQYREKIGVLRGDPKTTGGGKAKNYRMAVRVDVRRGEFITTKANGAGDKVGQRIHFHTVKNKSAPPRQVAQVDYYFRDWDGHKAGEYDLVKEVASLARLFGVAVKSGSGYTIGDVRYRGKEHMDQTLREDQELFHKVWDAVLTAGPKRRLDDPDPVDVEAEGDEEDPPDYVSPAPRHRTKKKPSA
jgi:recombination protein RecA